MLSQTAPVALSGTGSGSPSSTSSTQPPNSGTRPAGSAAKTGVAAPPSTSLLPAPAGLSPPHPSVSPVHTLHRGDLVTLTGSGFANGASVTIWFYSQPIVVGRARADRLGHFTATVPVPGSASAGHS